MKITKRQLRKIIKETMDPMDPNTPDIVYLSESDSMYSYMQDRADQAYQRGVRRFGEFWKENWGKTLRADPELQPNTFYDEDDAKRTMKKIWKMAKEDNRPRDRYDRWSAWD